MLYWLSSLQTVFGFRWYGSGPMGRFDGPDLLAGKDFLKSYREFEIGPVKLWSEAGESASLKGSTFNHQKGARWWWLRCIPGTCERNNPPKQGLNSNRNQGVIKGFQVVTVASHPPGCHVFSPLESRALGWWWLIWPMLGLKFEMALLTGCWCFQKTQKLIGSYRSYHWLGPTFFNKNTSQANI